MADNPRPWKLTNEQFHFTAPEEAPPQALGFGFSAAPMQHVLRAPPHFPRPMPINHPMIDPMPDPRYDYFRCGPDSTHRNESPL
ncbi:hypothetical protein CDL15_Pgr015976 [Punica granatum]|uniref:Uncharacterized protein n=1 Tax=Punica granatum TaxID=22663 RepID=A0A218XQ23_PUNGR|nr:hypothetical protein CDL15_Pgr015976 [Punica granatum]